MVIAIALRHGLLLQPIVLRGLQMNDAPTLSGTGMIHPTPTRYIYSAKHTDAAHSWIATCVMEFGF
jgi:hypothetical protein